VASPGASGNAHHRVGEDDLCVPSYSTELVAAPAPRWTPSGLPAALDKAGDRQSADPRRGHRPGAEPVRVRRRERALTSTTDRPRPHGQASPRRPFRPAAARPAGQPHPGVAPGTATRPTRDAHQARDPPQQADDPEVHAAGAPAPVRADVGDVPPQPRRADLGVRLPAAHRSPVPPGVRLLRRRAGVAAGRPRTSPTSMRRARTRGSAKASQRPSAPRHLPAAPRVPVGR
jgi:hypothetical protein